MRIEGDTIPGSEPAYAAEVLADLEAAFGPDRLQKLLQGLAEEIDKRLGLPSSDPRRLADDAHALTSVSGTLGFTLLSRACADLERACLSGEESGECLRRASTEAERAKAALAALHLRAQPAARA